MRVTLAQIPVYDYDINANLQNIKDSVKQAADENSDILLTPEGALSGYTHKFDSALLNEALTELVAFAAEHRTGLALGTCMEEDKLRYNEVRIYTSAGEYLGYHTKTLLCGTGDPPDGEINHFATKPLRVFDFNDVTVGALICNDLWANPACTPMPDIQLAKQLYRMGAKIIFHAVNGGRDESVFSQETVRTFHEVNVLMQANAYGLVICSVDNARPEHIGVSSVGGIATADGTWKFTLPVVGRQVSTFEI